MNNFFKSTEYSVLLFFVDLFYHLMDIIYRGVIMIINDNVKYVGVDDLELDLFEGQFKIPLGIAYNSYVIMDEKIAIMDSVDIRFANQWIKNIKAAIGERTPSYLIVQHMEPDHSSSIMKFLESFGNVTIVASAKAFVMMRSFFGNDFTNMGIIVGDGDSISLGKRELLFISAPMVHWPEVIMTYDQNDKILFSADAFGKFGALCYEDEWIHEARRYYFGIVGKYGSQVQALLKKLKNLDIKVICSLHGTVLSQKPDYYFNLYDIWSSYRAEENGVLIAYTSVYGNTKKAAEILRNLLVQKGVKVSLFDLARCDIYQAVADAFRYNRLVLATTTYNAGIFPHMKEFIEHLINRNYGNRQVGFIENGSWSPIATVIMKDKLKNGKNLKFAKTDVRILSALNEESLKQIRALSEELS